MFSIDFFTSLPRFCALPYNHRIETLSLMMGRMRRMEDEKIFLSDEELRKKLQKETEHYRKRFERWSKIHAKLPW